MSRNIGSSRWLVLPLRDTMAKWVNVWISTNLNAVVPEWTIGRQRSYTLHLLALFLFWNFELFLMSFRETANWPLFYSGTGVGPELTWTRRFAGTEAPAVSGEVNKEFKASTSEHWLELIFSSSFVSGCGSVCAAWLWSFRCSVLCSLTGACIFLLKAVMIPTPLKTMCSAKSKVMYDILHF